MLIPYQQLSADTLRAVIEDFVTRSYEEFGDSETTLDERVAQVMSQLRRGEAVITYDEEEKSVNIANARQLQAAGRGGARE